MTILASAPPSTVRHALHGEASIWPEKNCYIDLWIELLHALHLEPRAMLPLCLAVDFEGDQWTFYKPSFDELRRLYGIDVQELTLWRPVLDHVEEQLRAGHLVTLEADAWWLPDTAATDYRQQHSKTTIAICQLDRRARQLGYFHNAGRYELNGADFDGLFRQAEPHALAGSEGATATATTSATVSLAPYAELIRLDRLQRRPEVALRALARELVGLHAARRSATALSDSNPVQRFAARWAADLPALQAAGLPHYHRWAFSNLRQLGSACELAAEALLWCWPGELAAGEPESTSASSTANASASASASAAAAALRLIAERCKSLILKGARSVALQRPLDVAAALQECIEAWDRAMAQVDALQPRQDAAA